MHETSAGHGVVPSSQVGAKGPDRTRAAHHICPTERRNKAHAANKTMQKKLMHAFISLLVRRHAFPDCGELLWEKRAEPPIFFLPFLLDKEMVEQIIERLSNFRLQTTKNLTPKKCQ